VLYYSARLFSMHQQFQGAPLCAEGIAPVLFKWMGVPYVNANLTFLAEILLLQIVLVTVVGVEYIANMEKWKMQTVVPHVHATMVQFLVEDDPFEGKNSHKNTKDRFSKILCVWESWDSVALAVLQWIIFEYILCRYYLSVEMYFLYRHAVRKTRHYWTKTSLSISHNHKKRKKIIIIHFLRTNNYLWIELHIKYK